MKPKLDEKRNSASKSDYGNGKVLKYYAAKVYPFNVQEENKNLMRRLSAY